MDRVIHIHDVPEDLWSSLSAAADREGLSLSRFVLRELERVVDQARIVQHNAKVIRETQARVRGRVDRATILAALRDGRPD